MSKSYTVTQLNIYIKNMFEQDYLLNNVTVNGEVSNCKYHTSGHIYFTLKDDNGTLSVIMFKGNTFNGLKFRLENGQKICVTGSVKVYERDGKYQLYARSISLEGQGELYKRYLALKDELEEMGMFSKQYKKPIPLLSRRVGIVTAKTGAAIQDICNIAKRRNPYVSLYLYPSIVQGPQAKDSIVSGLRKLDKLNLDVIIVGRGGGSIEDLWAFNEECVARAIFECNTPVISAVGHETDFTISDFVADLRASTPSAAAELAVCDIELVENKIIDCQKALNKAFETKLTMYRELVLRHNNTLLFLNPARRVLDNRVTLLNTEDKLHRAMETLLNNYRNRLCVLAAKLNGLSPLDKLSQGYCVATNACDSVITSINDVTVDESIAINVSDGCIYADVKSVIPNKAKQ